MDKFRAKSSSLYLLTFPLMMSCLDWYLNGVIFFTYSFVSILETFSCLSFFLEEHCYFCREVSFCFMPNEDWAELEGCLGVGLTSSLRCNKTTVLSFWGHFFNVEKRELEDFVDLMLKFWFFESVWFFFSVVLAVSMFSPKVLISFE